MRYSRGSPRRVAASEAVGAMLAIAMTLIAGAAAWGFVRGQASSSENAILTGSQTNSNFLSEQFKVTDMNFPSTTQETAWVYNVGRVTLSVLSVRLYDSAGLINVLYNYTQSSSGTRTDHVYDLKSSGSNYYAVCKLAGSSYESPTISSIKLKLTDVQTLALTIPPTTSGCPSYGQTFTSGTTYTIVVTGLYGNVQTYYMVK